MDTQEIVALLALTNCDGIGPVHAKNLITALGSATKVFSSPKGLLKDIPDVRQSVIESLFAQKEAAFAWATQAVKQCQEHQISIVTYFDPTYPELLKAIHNAPPLLYIKGNPIPNNQPSIAIVGTRKPTDYGRKQTRRFAAHFVEQGINVVSGLAYGIDGEAHKTVVEMKGTTTAILGHGLQFLYPPQHKTLADSILQNGTLLTEYPFETKIDARNFVYRNRLIAGMSKATIVIESAKRGGGLVTAQYAFDQNREVYAIPGNLGTVTSEGCNWLISENIAKLALSPEHVLEDLDLSATFAPTSAPNLFNSQPKSEPKPITIPLSADEQTVINHLSLEPTHIDLLEIKTGLSISQLTSILLMLEFNGIVEQKPGRLFCRI